MFMKIKFIASKDIGLLSDQKKGDSSMKRSPSHGGIELLAPDQNRALTSKVDGTGNDISLCT